METYPGIHKKIFMSKLCLTLTCIKLIDEKKESHKITLGTQFLPLMLSYVT